MQRHDVVAAQRCLSAAQPCAWLDTPLRRRLRLASTLCWEDSSTACAQVLLRCSPAVVASRRAPDYNEFQLSESHSFFAHLVGRLKGASALTVELEVQAPARLLLPMLGMSVGVCRDLCINVAAALLTAASPAMLPLPLCDGAAGHRLRHHGSQVGLLVPL